MSAASRPAVRADDVEAAMKRAMGLLAVRARSCQELRDRLLRAGFDHRAAEAVELRLLNVGLLDDAAFAAQVVRSGFETGKSARLTRRKLALSGVDPEVADASLMELDQPGGDQERALQLAERKAATCRNLPAGKAIPRVVRHLCSKGYGPELAWEVSRKVFRDADFPYD